MGHMRFVLTGTTRSGLAAMSARLDSVPGIVCHPFSLFSADPEERKNYCLDWFGHDVCFDPEKHPPGRYLQHAILDDVPKDGKAIGVVLPAEFIHANDMYDWLSDMSSQGDFCVLYVSRNPVEALVSAQRKPPIVSLEARALREAVDRSEGIRWKICDAAKSDLLDIPYSDVCLDIAGVARRMARYLEVSTDKYQFPSAPYATACRPSKDVAEWPKVVAQLSGPARHYAQNAH